jgi:hypothetical protein
VEVINAVFHKNFAEGTEFGRKLSDEKVTVFVLRRIFFRLAESRRKRWVRHIARVRYFINAHINFRFETPERIKGRENQNEGSKYQRPSQHFCKSEICNNEFWM